MNNISVNSITKNSIIILKCNNDQTIVATLISDIDFNSKFIVLKDACVIFDVIDKHNNVITVIKLWDKFSLNDEILLFLDKVVSISLAGIETVNARTRFFTQIEQENNTIKENTVENINPYIHEGSILKH